MMAVEHWITAFLERIHKDPRVSIVHIGVFSVMAHCCTKFGNNGKCIMFRSDIMHIAKISSASTYYKVIKELSDYGYIKYSPSRYHLYGSMITLLPDTNNNKIQNIHNRHENKNENNSHPGGDSEHILRMP